MAGLLGVASTEISGDFLMYMVSTTEENDKPRESVGRLCKN